MAVLGADRVGWSHRLQAGYLSLQATQQRIDMLAAMMCVGAQGMPCSWATRTLAPGVIRMP